MSQIVGSYVTVWITFCDSLGDRQCFLLYQLIEVELLVEDQQFHRLNILSLFVIPLESLLSL